MKLSKLLKDLFVDKVFGNKSIEITGICSHSKRVSPGNLFIAKKGEMTDGNLYIYEALSAGASAIVTDMVDPTIKTATQIIHHDIPEIEGKIVSRYYEHPSHEMKLVGITGTKGKTTTTYLTRHLFESLGVPMGLMGTIEYIVGEHCYPASHTTPDVLTNHRLLREMVNQGIQAAVMEVSSHALDQRRVDEIEFDIGVFTNLTPDHLDYHGTMEEYLQAKCKLFQKLKDKKKSIAVINIDSPSHQEVLKCCPKNVLTYSVEGSGDLNATNIHLFPSKTVFDVTYDCKTYTCKSPLIGGHNISNTLAALAIGVASGFSLPSLIASIESFPPVPGRLELVPNELGLNLYVDFAHSGEALRSVLQELSKFKKGNIITLFGCGGNRDPRRRVGMAKAAEEYSDTIIVTSDNPRKEDPLQIVEDILKGFTSLDPVIVEIDRQKAIEKAIDLGKANDIILLAGKGHEKNQIFENKTVDFDDCKVASDACVNKLVAL